MKKPKDFCGGSTMKIGCRSRSRVTDWEENKIRNQLGEKEKKNWYGKSRVRKRKVRKSKVRKRKVRKRGKF